MKARGRYGVPDACVTGLEARVRSPRRDYPLGARLEDRPNDPVLVSRPLMRETDFDLELRTATLDDAGIVADLEAARNPEDPRDPTMLRLWWAARAPDESHPELVAENDGAAMAYRLVDPLIELHRGLNS